MAQNIELKQFNNLSELKGLRHGITNRTGGYSNGKYESLNLAEHVSDSLESVLENKKGLSEFINVQQIIFPQQTHSNNVKCVVETTNSSDLLETDAVITDGTGICIGVLTADCVPVLLHDPVKKVSAAIHAGWKGSVENICGNTIRMMANNFGCKPKNIIAGIGPSISSRNYEVGKEVIYKVDQIVSPQLPILSQRENDKAKLDLWMLNKVLMIQEGVKQDNIEVMGVCTYDDASFFSARRDGIMSGRFASFILNC